MTSCEEMRNAFIEDMAELKRFFDWIFSWNHSQIRARNSFLEMACMHLTESRSMSTAPTYVCFVCLLARRYRPAQCSVPNVFP
jgi:hypothetical protein